MFKRLNPLPNDHSTQQSTQAVHCPVLSKLLQPPAWLPAAAKHQTPTITTNGHPGLIERIKTSRMPLGWLKTANK